MEASEAAYKVTRLTFRVPLICLCYVQLCFWPLHCVVPMMNC